MIDSAWIPWSVEVEGVGQMNRQPKMMQMRCLSWCQNLDGTRGDCAPALLVGWHPVYDHVLNGGGEQRHGLALELRQHWWIVPSRSHLALIIPTRLNGDLSRS